MRQYFQSCPDESNPFVLQIELIVDLVSRREELKYPLKVLALLE